VDDLPNVNTHHFSADSQVVIGRRFGEAFQRLQEKADDARSHCGALGIRPAWRQ
jgi:hypothetical protein